MGHVVKQSNYLKAPTSEMRKVFAALGHPGSLRWRQEEPFGLGMYVVDMNTWFNRIEAHLQIKEWLRDPTMKLRFLNWKHARKEARLARREANARQAQPTGG